MKNFEQRPSEGGLKNAFAKINWLCVVSRKVSLKVIKR